MGVSLIIDGNYILKKTVPILHKTNSLYGKLHSSLLRVFQNNRQLHHFGKIYLVCDPRSQSWRKSAYPTYKANRKKNEEIDWEFVFIAYEETKQELKELYPSLVILEGENIEGDDWITFLVNKENALGNSTLIISNDHDIKQLLTVSIDPLYINLMYNDMSEQATAFFPKGRELFKYKHGNLFDDSFFSTVYQTSGYESGIIELMDKLSLTSKVVEVSPYLSLLQKIIMGDSGDNIPSVWQKIVPGKRTVGIGEKGAEKIASLYEAEHGEFIDSGEDFVENLANIILKNKKLPLDEKETIMGNIRRNYSLIRLNLSRFPTRIVENMNNIFEKNTTVPYEGR